MTPLDFLNLLWQFKPEEVYVLIWTLPDKCSYWYRDVAAAAAFVLNLRGLDVYVGVGLSNADRGSGHRCTSDEVVGLERDADCRRSCLRGTPSARAFGPSWCNGPDSLAVLQSPRVGWWRAGHIPARHRVGFSGRAQ